LTLVQYGLWLANIPFTPPFGGAKIGFEARSAKAISSSKQKMEEKGIGAEWWDQHPPNF
jgi:hypothetical protein